MSMFSPAELAYLGEGSKLGRLATLDPDGTPNVVPLGWNYNPEHDTIDIGGRDFASTRKFRNVLANPAVGFVVDDVAPPWRPRAVQIRGTAEALSSATWPDGRPREAILRITPTRVVSWGITED
jgi:pyridoxamine 5'-phosphate oxidase family protein